MTPPGFPHANEDDLEDVAWGLTTGDVLWKQGEHLDALVWLRRAASSANEAGELWRADELKLAAASLMAALEAGDLDSDPPPPLPDEADGDPEAYGGVADEARREKETSDIDDLLAKSVRGHADHAADETSGVAAGALEEILAEELEEADLEEDSELDENDEKEVAAATPPESAPRSQTPPPRSMPPVPDFSLDDVPAFADLPDDARELLRKAAEVEILAADEEVPLVGLAYVIDGSAAVQAAVAESTAARVKTGDIVYGKGSLADPISLRLVAGDETATLALFRPEIIDAHLASCPWVLEELRDAADRLQALAGVTVGPLGERLDEGLRAVATGPLKVRVFEPGEIMATRGQPVSGMMIVGGGTVELDARDDGAAGDGGEGAAAGGEVAKLYPGDFLFSTEVLGSGPAPANARAGPKGALVLFGDRQVAHELLVSCPPLLEIFAGM